MSDRPFSVCRKVSLWNLQSEWSSSGKEFFPGWLKCGEAVWQREKRSLT